MSLSPNVQAKVSNYLKGKRFLLIDPNKSCRVLMRKLLIGFGVPIPAISVATSLEEGLEMVSDLGPHYVFCYYRDEENEILPIIKKHFEKHPDRAEAAFFQFVSQKDAYFAAAIKREYPIEASVYEPLTGEKINIPFMKDLKSKLAPSKDFKALQKIKNLYYSGKNKDCFEAVESMISNHRGDISDIIYYSGLALIKLNQPDQAINRFEMALEYRLHHYGALKQLFLHYLKKGDWLKAYEYQVGLLENHPLNPALIPQHVLVFIRMKKFAQIYDIAVLFAELPVRDQDTQKHIAAGLVMAGRFFMKVKDPELGKKILFKAADLSNGRIEIIKNVAMGLLEGKFFDDGYAIIDKFAQDADNSLDYQVLELEYMERAARYTKVLTLGIGLLQKGMKTFNVYQAVIRTSIKMKRNVNIVHDLVNSAASSHPEKAADLFRMLEDYKSVGK